MSLTFGRASATVSLQKERFYPRPAADALNDIQFLCSGSRIPERRRSSRSRWRSCRWVGELGAHSSAVSMATRAKRLSLSARSGKGHEEISYLRSTECSEHLARFTAPDPFNCWQQPLPSFLRCQR